ncbi:hypothetical protein O3642_01145 [Streptococcus sp. 27098_8_66]|uniref:hypothetical protein n=1 Tax=Streptococcus sp. 27098_8_66 TaxID=3003649 RepID=UPI00352F38BD
MDKEQWIEIFKEINDRVPTEEEIQAGVQSGEIIVSDLSAISKVNDSESNATPHVQPQVELNEYVSQNVAEIQNDQNVKFCNSCGTKNFGNSKQCSGCGKYFEQDDQDENMSYIKKSRLYKYLKYCYDTQRWNILIYFCLVTLVQTVISLFSIPFLIFLLSEKGQSLICWIVGAKRIDRSDYQEKVQQPVNEIIQKARQKGLNLPDNIEIRMIHNDVPAAYAIGMNKIIVTDSLLENPYFLEPKIMFELHRIHNMAPNLLPVVVGSNIILIIVLLILLITTLFGGFKKNYGDSRNSFWSGSSETKEGAILFYGSIILIVGLISIFLLFVKSIVKRDVYLSDQYMAAIGFGEIHCYYIDTVSEEDGSLAKGFCELGYPSKDKRISILQNNYHVRYTGV